MQIAQHWRLNTQRYQLTGERCVHCGYVIFPPRDVCPSCVQPAQRLQTLSGRGTLYSYTIVYDTPAGFDEQAPYVLALIQLDDGPMLTAQLTDLGDSSPEIGMPVEMVTRKLRTDGERGVILYGYKFRPLLVRQ